MSVPLTTLGRGRWAWLIWGVALSSVTWYLNARPVEPRLFSSPRLGESVFSVSAGAPLGYLRVTQRPNRPNDWVFDLELRILEGRRLVHQQMSFRVITDRRVTLNNSQTPYVLSWRQLTSEGRSWWEWGEPPQLSQGTWVMRSQRGHETRADEVTSWCLWRDATQSHEVWSLPNQARSSTALSALLHLDQDTLKRAGFSEVSCLPKRALPDSVWPWLSDGLIQDDQATQLHTFSETSGVLYQGELVRTSPERAERSLGPSFDQSVAQLWRLSDPKRSSEVVLRASQIMSWRAQHGQIDWRLRRAPWRGWSSEPKPIRSSEVVIKGSAPWRSARWVDLRLDAPIPPLSSHRQEVSVEAEVDRGREVDQAVSAQQVLSALKSYRLLTQRQVTPPPSERSFNPLASEEEVLREVYPLINQHLSLSESGVIRDEIKVIRALSQWVYTAIEFKPHAGVPDPLLALRRGSGDCNERSAALTSLLSALGFDVKQVFGLLWLGGERWGWHAWVQVKLSSGWYEVDPSAPQLEVGPSHIAFSAGDQRAQSEILHLLGRVSGSVRSWSR